MKIELNNSTPDPIVAQRADENRSASPSQVRNSAEDTTTLSFDHSSVGSLVSQAMASPDVRQEKVEALRQAISDGQFKVEPDKIAEAMLQGPKS